MLQSVVTKILVGPDPGLLNTPHTRIALATCGSYAHTGTHEVALRAYPKNVHQPWPLALK